MALFQSLFVSDLLDEAIRVKSLMAWKVPEAEALRSMTKLNALRRGGRMGLGLSSCMVYSLTGLGSHHHAGAQTPSL